MTSFAPDNIPLEQKISDLALLIEKLTNVCLEQQRQMDQLKEDNQSLKFLVLQYMNYQGVETEQFKELWDRSQIANKAHNFETLYRQTND